VYGQDVNCVQIHRLLPLEFLVGVPRVVEQEVMEVLEIHLATVPTAAEPARSTLLDVPAAPVDVLEVCEDLREPRERAEPGRALRRIDIDLVRPEKPQQLVEVPHEAHGA
jgi:hypothetical protein